jgi:hypothetical protein
MPWKKRLSKRTNAAKRTRPVGAGPLCKQKARQHPGHTMGSGSSVERGGVAPLPERLTPASRFRGKKSIGADPEEVLKIYQPPVQVADVVGAVNGVAVSRNPGVLWYVVIQLKPLGEWRLCFGLQYAVASSQFAC